jgi:hypothetical protein
MKKIGIGLIAIALICSFGYTASADTTQELTITLEDYTVASILLNNTSWNPTAGLDASDATPEDNYNLSNDGAVQLSIDIKALVSPTWSLGSTPDHDQLYLAYNVSGSGTEITTGDLEFAANMAHDGFQNFGMYIEMPTTSSTSTAQTITVTFTATAD